MKKLTIRIRKDTKVAFEEMGDRFIETWKDEETAPIISLRKASNSEIDKYEAEGRK